MAVSSRPVSRFPVRLEVPKGPITVEGTRRNARMLVEYVEGWLNGRGAKDIDSLAGKPGIHPALMEDLATGRMSTAQIAQRVLHRVRSDDGVVHDFALVRRLLEEETEDIIKLGSLDADSAARYRKASRIAAQWIRNYTAFDFRSLGGRRIPVDQLFGRVPVGTSPHCVESSSGRRTAQRHKGELPGRERAEWNHSMRTRQPRQDEAIDAVLHGSREKLRQQSWVATIRAPERVEIPGTILLENHGGRIPVPHQQQIEDQAAGSSISVEKGMDLFQPTMSFGEVSEEMAFVRTPVAESQPILNGRLR
ncbi:MAG: hypothetical protein FJZ38_14930 [Candidatus Rokubacteria bacterium]|nr:hypothetical protein [Candidatus Rokubacteria bacterium]